MGGEVDEAPALGLLRQPPQGGADRLDVGVEGRGVGIALEQLLMVQHDLVGRDMANLRVPFGERGEMQIGSTDRLTFRLEMLR